MKSIDKEKFFKDIGYEPHSRQWLVHNSAARFRTVVAGRRFGKSLLAAGECLARLLHPNQRIWVVAPTYDLAKRIFREVFWRLQRHIPRWVKKSSEADLSIELVNGSTAVCKSCDNPKSLLGEGLNFLIIDEAAHVPEQVWNEALRPTLSDRKGDALFISTPQPGQSWFRVAFTRGQDPIESQWESWHFRSVDNPYLDPDEIAEARRTLPDRVFAQEYEAVFSSEAGAVFRDVDSLATGALEEPDFAGRYVMGVDLARLRDFTVLIVLRTDVTPYRVVALERFNEVAWSLQRQRIRMLATKYRCPVVLDATGTGGDVVFEDLHRDGLHVIPRTFTVKVKKLLIENLSAAIDKHEIIFPPDPVLIEELRSFSYTYREASGTLRYSAPSSGHDDTVIALALAVDGASHTPLVSAVVSASSTRPFLGSHLTRTATIRFT